MSNMEKCHRNKIIIIIIIIIIKELYLPRKLFKCEHVSPQSDRGRRGRPHRTHPAVAVGPESSSAASLPLPPRLASGASVVMATFGSTEPAGGDHHRSVHLPPPQPQTAHAGHTVVETPGFGKSRNSHSGSAPERVTVEERERVCCVCMCLCMCVYLCVSCVSVVQYIYHHHNAKPPTLVTLLLKRLFW